MTTLNKLLLMASLLGTGFTSIQCQQPTLDPVFDTLEKIDPALNTKELYFGTTLLFPGASLVSKGHKLVVKHGSKVIGNALRIPGAGLVGLSIFCIADAINKTR